MRLLGALLLAQLLFPPFALSGDGTEAVVEKYIALWQKGDVVRAVESCWDIEGFLDRSFGQRYRSLTESEKNYLQKITELNIIVPNTFQEVASVVPEARFGNMEVRENGDGTKTVNVGIETEEGDTWSAGFVLRSSGASWRIIDSFMVGNPMVSESMRKLMPGLDRRITPVMITEALLNKTLEKKIGQY